MIPKHLQEKLKPFIVLGADFSEVRDKEVIGRCPFTGDERKFFVNWTNLLWDSKTAGLQGDLSDFFEAICARNAERINDTIKLIELARNRRLPTEAFEGYGIGWDGKQYTIPIFNAKGKVTDVRRVFLKPDHKQDTYGMVGAKVGLFNCDSLIDPQLESEPVYLCEGEWDTIALNWLLTKNKAPGFAVGAPGANTFKIEWRELFRKRHVTVCYDNDHAGAAGEQTVLRRLSDVVTSIDFIRWRDDIPEGFDVRDWVCNGFKRKIPEKSLSKFLLMKNPKPRIVQASGVAPGDSAEKPQRVITKRSKHEDLYRAFSSHLKLESEDILAVVMATVLVNRLPGDPLWLLLVGKSGAGKTEFLSTLEGYGECVFTAEFTPHTLVSGMPSATGVDPSLLPKLDNKVLVIKDFTVILSMHPTGRDEIFGQLREAYDGKYTKQFGNGLVRQYNSKFGMIAGVTNKVDEYASLHAGLGERFLKCRVYAPALSMESDIIMSAIMKSGKEDGMRSELRSAVESFLDNIPAEDPDVTQEVAETITAVAIVVSRLRGTVSLNEYTGVQHSKAMFEMGTRLAKQLARLWKGLYLYFNNGFDALRIVKRVALGSVVDKREEVVRRLYDLLRAEGKPVSRTTISKACSGISDSTVARELDELALLGITTSSARKGNAKHWSFTAEFTKMLERSKLFS